MFLFYFDFTMGYKNNQRRRAAYAEKKRIKEKEDAMEINGVQVINKMFFMEKKTHYRPKIHS